jgi:alpha-glucosidase (family GH31 glycosyl hydrolase)
MNNSVVEGNRRFSCLAPGLIRMEFAPDGVFEDRRSIVAYEKQMPEAFKSIRKNGDELVLETGKCTLVSRQHDKAFFRSNLELRWEQHDLLQYWRPGDRDHLNLGGTIRSLDMFNRTGQIKGVHIADMESPDAKANMWLSWLWCEDDPPFYQQKHGPDAQKKYLVDDMHAMLRHTPEKLLAGLRNHTLDQHMYAPGIISRSGYFLLNDSISAVMDKDDFPVERNRPGYQDLYFFCYGDDYKSGLADLILLTGKAPLPSKNTLGFIFSRWPAYDEAEAKALIARFASEEIPISTLVLDMEWHKEGWCNWDWDPKMYPDPKAFFSWCHQRDIDVTLNVHPMHIRDNDSHFTEFVAARNAQGQIESIKEDSGNELKRVKVDICNKDDAKAFMHICHDEIVKQGLDYWWVDGTYGQINGSCDQLVTNKLYFESVDTPDKRGMLLSRYGGLGSHRYGAFFTGDTYSEWEVLATECEFNIRAGMAGINYISHDIGGFSRASAPLTDPDLYVRWLEFGVFNPVLRLHSAPGCGSRQPWDYGDVNFKTARKWLQTRLQMSPYLYSAAREHYECGIPIIRGLFLEHPEDEAGYRFDEFYFGPSMLVAPLLTPGLFRQVYLPAGSWYEYATNRQVDGGKEFTARATLAEIPVYVKAGGILPMQADFKSCPTGHVQNLLLKVYPGANGSTVLYEDDGKTPSYEQGEYCKTRYELKSKGGKLILTGQCPEGKLLGKTRKITVELAKETAPASISLDGRRLNSSQYEWNREKSLLKIELGELKASQAFRLEVEDGVSTTTEQK